MGIVCVICNRKQSGWIEDFPLSLELSEQRICANCHEKLKKLENSSTPENEVEAIEYMEKYLETINSFDVKEYLETVIVEAKGAAARREKEAEEIAFQKQQTAEQAAEEERIFNQKIQDLILTTGTSFEGYKVEKYIDVICEEIVFKNSLWKQISAGFEDFANALSFKDKEMSGASELIANARRYIMEKFKEKAVRLDANAILGIDFESSFGSDVVRVSVFGTAVCVKKSED